tara:strand:+ start:3272 stop:3442 length:171 start_codon:yes stop_codon:yes gene_type:complete
MRALIVFATIKGEKMSKGDWPRPVNQKKFDEEFDRIFKKKKKKGGDSKVLNGDSRV